MAPACPALQRPSPQASFSMVLPFLSSPFTMFVSFENNIYFLVTFSVHSLFYALWRNDVELHSQLSTVLILHVCAQVTFPTKI